MQNEDRNHIITKLKNIQAQQTALQQEQNELIEQLRDLSIQTNNTQVNEEDDDDNTFHLGDKVVILNPGRFQEKKGTICNLGNSRVTIQTKRGKKIIRAPFNVRKDRQQS